MLPMIQQALFYGFSAAQVLKYFSGKFPSFQQPINAAMNAGFSPEKILDYLVKNPKAGFTVKNKKEQDQINKQFDSEYQNYLEKTGVKKDKDDLSNFFNTAATAAAIAPIGYGLYQGGKSLINFAANNQTLKNFVSGQLFGQNPMAANLLNAQGQGAQNAPPAQPSQVPPQQAQPAQPATPQAASPPPMPPASPVANQPNNTPIGEAPSPEQAEQEQKAGDVINFIGFGRRLENMLSAGNSPETIAVAVEHMLSGPQRKYVADYLKKSGKDLNQFVTDAIQDLGLQAKPEENKGFSKGQSVFTRDGQEGTIKAANDKNAIVSVNGKDTQIKISDLIKSAGNLFKENMSVGLPGGDIGRIVKMMGNKAQVEVGGKLKEIDASKLEKEPEEVESLDLEGLAKKYLDAIPEDRKSAPFSMAVYQPSNKTMIVKFHSGDTWAYTGLDKDTFDRIVNEQEVAKTSGKDEFTGAIWQEGKPSRGGGFHKLIKEAVKRGDITEEKLHIGFETFGELQKKSKKKRKNERA